MRVTNNALAVKTSEGIYVEVIIPPLQEKMEKGAFVSADGPFSIERGRNDVLYLKVHAHYLRVDGRRIL